MDPPIEIRDIDIIQDNSLVRELLRLNHFALSGEELSLIGLNRTIDFLYSTECIFLVADIDSENVGFTTGRIIEGGKCYESVGLYVRENFRRQGVASLLKRKQIDIARDLECNMISTFVQKDFNGSLKLQEKFGFNLNYDFEQKKYLATLNL